MPVSYQNLALELAVKAPALRLRITGTSMAPLLQEGDFVILHACPGALLRLGDLIAVRQDGDTVTHRLIAFQPDHLITLGDNLYMPDPPVSPEFVLGRAIALEKNARLTCLNLGGCSLITFLPGLPG